MVRAYPATLRVISATFPVNSPVGQLTSGFKEAGSTDVKTVEKQLAHRHLSLEAVDKALGEAC